MIGSGENLGSGFPLILSAWNEKHWLKPELIEQRELMQLAVICGISEDGIYWNMKQLRGKGRIRRIGGDKGGRWEVIVQE